MEQLIALWEKKVLEPDLALYMKINSKWVIDLNTSVKTIKFLKEHTEENLYDIELDKDFFNRTTAV